jgi:hypothetical protein
MSLEIIISSEKNLPAINVKIDTATDVPNYEHKGKVA